MIKLIAERFNMKLFVVETVIAGTMALGTWLYFLANGYITLG